MVHHHVDVDAHGGQCGDVVEVAPEGPLRERHRAQRGEGRSSDQLVLEIQGGVVERVEADPVRGGQPAVPGRSRDDGLAADLLQGVGQRDEGLGVTAAPGRDEKKPQGHRSAPSRRKASDLPFKAIHCAPWSLSLIHI